MMLPPTITTMPLAAGWYRLRTPDGRFVSRNFFEDRSLRPKRIVVHESYEERLEDVTRWLWTPAPADESTPSTEGDAGAEVLEGTLTNIGWRAGAHEGRIMAHFYDDWIEGSHGARLRLRLQLARASEECVVVVAAADESSFWGMVEREGDVMAHLVAVKTADEAMPLTFERLADPS